MKKSFVERLEDEKNKFSPEQVREMLMDALRRRVALYDKVEKSEYSQQCYDYDFSLAEAAISWTKKIEGTANEEELAEARKFNPSLFSLGLDKFFKMADNSDEGYQKDFDLRQAINSINKKQKEL